MNYLEFIESISKSEKLGIFGPIISYLIHCAVIILPLLGIVTLLKPILGPWLCIVLCMLWYAILIFKFMADNTAVKKKGYLKN
jgi:hypothetical protein